MRRSTRSTGGRPISPDPEFYEPEERNTRSRKSSEDLVVLELPRTTRTYKHSANPDGKGAKESEDRSTRSRRASGEHAAQEQLRNTRTGKRSSSGKSPEGSKTSPRDRGTTSSETKHKHDKRSLSPVEPGKDAPTKRRRRSGRLADVEEENEKQESAEKQEKDGEEKRRRSGRHVEADSEKDKDYEEAEDEEEHKKEISSREKSMHHPHVKEKTEKDKDEKVSKSKGKDAKNQETSSREQKNLEDAASEQRSRKRTRSGRYVAEDFEGDIKSDKDTSTDSRVDNKSDNSKTGETKSKKEKDSKKSGSSRHASEKELDKSLRDRSPPKSPKKVSNETIKVDAQSKVDLQKLEVDLSDLTAKNSDKKSSRGPLSPPLRMSPRRARHPSGQKSSDVDSSGKIKDSHGNAQTEESGSVAVNVDKIDKEKINSTGDEQSEKPSDKQKKSSVICRDLSAELSDSKDRPMSPIRQTRSRKEEDIQVNVEGTSLNEKEISISVPKSPTKLKKSRSPCKSPRGDGTSVSPRKGLRSCRAQDLQVAVEGDVAGTDAGEQESKIDVVSMETDQPLLAIQSLGAPFGEGQGAVNAEVDETLEDIPEEKPTLSEMLAIVKQKEEEDVSEISDEVAAKIREWKMQEEESVGFQGDEWYAEEVDEAEPFYFESDHMALKGNKDYRMLLRTITTLEAQRKQAVKDLDKLVIAQREALRNPLKFVHKLQKKDSLHLPSAQRIVQLPEIPWGRYLGHADSKELIQGLSHQTRASLKQKTNGPSSEVTTSSSLPLAGPSTARIIMDDEDEENKNSIRGRTWDETKPDTFNRLWTVEEQKRLENLLVKFPMEEVEARRWEKIAKELGNRTRHQVASRVQKFFIKLGKAGLPIPGRMPNLANYHNKRPQQRRYINPYNKITMAPSVFLQSIRAPVLMNDDDDGFDMDFDYDADSIMEEDDIPHELKESEEFKELMRLKKIRNITIKQEAEVSHVGFSCDSCGVSPIMGVRWHCVNCPEEVSTDLCQSCMDEDFQSDVHTSSHRLEPVHANQAGGFVDSDYTSFTGMSGDYNYLDPNYSPAVL